MKQIDECRTKREAIMAKLEDEVRGFTEEERKEYDELKAKESSLKEVLAELKQLDSEERALTTESIGNQIGIRTSAQANPTKDNEDTFRHRLSVLKIMKAAKEGTALTGIEKEAAEEARREADELGRSVSGYSIPSIMITGKKLDSDAARNIYEMDKSDFERAKSEFNEKFVRSFLNGDQKRDLVVGTATAGGHGVQTNVQRYIEFLYPDLVLERAGARVLTGLSGPVKFPRKDSVGSIAWEGETDATAEMNPTLDQFTLTPKRAAGYIDVSLQLMIQGMPTFDAEMFAREDLINAVRQGVEVAVINGGGANEPNGILQIAGIGDVAHGTNGGAPTWATAIEFVTDLAAGNAYMGDLGWLITPEVIGQMMNIPKVSGQDNFIINEPGTTLLGHPIFWTNNLPKTLTKGTGTGLHAAIFGNFDELLIAQFGPIDLLYDPYTQKVSGLDRFVINSYWDCNLRHPASFSAAVDIDPTA